MLSTSYRLNGEKVVYRRVKSCSEKQVLLPAESKLKYAPADPIVLQCLRNTGTVRWVAVTGYCGFRGFWSPNPEWKSKGYVPCVAIGETEDGCLRELRKKVLLQVQSVACQSR